MGKGKDGIEPIKDLTFVGLVTLQDPPRDEVPQAIRECHSAGVKVVMVTGKSLTLYCFRKPSLTNLVLRNSRPGDHPLTAEAIARKIGLITTRTRKDVAAARGCTLEEVRGRQER